MTVIKKKTKGPAIVTKAQKSTAGKIITCKNCGTAFTGNFCNQCGQKAKIQRINLKHLLHDFFHALTHLDTGYIFTLKELALRPGHTIREYLQGKRSKHRDPLLMLLIIGGLCSLLYNHYHLKTLSSVDISSFKGDMQMFSLKFFALAFLGYSMVLSLFDFLFYRYKGFNYFELLVMNIFTCIEILFLFILIVPVWLFLRSYGIDSYLRIPIILVVFSYLVYVRYQFFEVAGDKKALFRILADAFTIIILFAVTGWKTWQSFLS